MQQRRRELSQTHRRRRLVALVGLLVAVLLLFLGLKALFAGDGHGNGEGEKAGTDSSQAARSWALERRIRQADEANRRAIDQALQVTPVLRRGSGGARQVALTFDDGPSAFTPQVVEILDKYDVKATFFVVGGASDAHAEMIKGLVARGHVVANHTVNHAALSTLPREEQAAEIDAQTRAIELFGAPKPHLFRPPYNAWDETTLDIVQRRKMMMVLWSVETNDWAKPGAAEIVNRTLSGVEPGAIVLFHDGGGDRTQTVEALPQIIESLQEQDYELVTIPQLLQDSPPDHDQR